MQVVGTGLGLLIAAAFAVGPAAAGGAAPALDLPLKLAPSKADPQGAPIFLTHDARTAWSAQKGGVALRVADGVDLFVKMKSGKDKGLSESLARRGEQPAGRSQAVKLGVLIRW